ncbi:MULTISPECIES: hypothetical protein [Pelosinus]|jgi:hypothetical protein|uniref:hypothetical protein n=1 Tax=Pelosinus TaxID=365348 RepID=UPI00037E4850|nr:MULTISPECIES: hypothetical protein [Pelosinus]
MNRIVFTSMDGLTALEVIEIICKNPYVVSVCIFIQLGIEIFPMDVGLWGLKVHHRLPRWLEGPLGRIV